MASRDEWMLRCLGAAALGGAVGWLAARRASKRHSCDIRVGFLGSIGQTPLIELPVVSELCGCRVLVKAEQMNPGGSIKDRPVKWMMDDLERQGRLKPGTTVVEATGGNTGLAIALLTRAKGYGSLFTVPEFLAAEKISMLRLFGAEVKLQPDVPFSDPRHYYQHAKALAAEPGSNLVWPDQFENLANYQAHLEGTGPEIIEQTGGNIDAFCCAAGTGGTLAGVSQFLKKHRSDIPCWLVDCPGSILADFVQSGGESKKPVPGKAGLIQEGIGIGRITANFSTAQVDGAVVASNQEALDMAYFLLRREGFFVGPSAAANVAGAIKVARELRLGPKQTIVTLLCDGGERYRSKIYNAEWQEKNNLFPSPAALEGQSLSFLG